MAVCRADVQGGLRTFEGPVSRDRAEGSFSKQEAESEGDGLNFAHPK